MRVKIKIVVGPEVVEKNKGSLEKYLSSKDHHVDIIKVDREFNFSDRINFGVEYSKSDQIIILNDDILIEHRDSLPKLINDFEKQSKQLMGVKLLYDDRKTIQHAGVTVERQLVDNYLRGFPNCVPHPGHSFMRNSSAITGAFMIISRKDFEIIDGFDLDFPYDFGDVDFCLKYSEVTGKKIIYNPGVLAVHGESKTRVIDYDLSLSEFIKLSSKWDLQKKDPNYLDYLTPHDT